MDLALILIFILQRPYVLSRNNSLDCSETTREQLHCTNNDDDIIQLKMLISCSVSGSAVMMSCKDEITVHMKLFSCKGLICPGGNSSLSLGLVAPNPAEKGSGNSPTTIAVGVISGVCVVCLAVLGAFYWTKKKTTYAVENKPSANKISSIQVPSKSPHAGTMQKKVGSSDGSGNTQVIPRPKYPNISVSCAENSSCEINSEKKCEPTNNMKNENHENPDSWNGFPPSNRKMKSTDNESADLPNQGPINDYVSTYSRPQCNPLQERFTPNSSSPSYSLSENDNKSLDLNKKNPTASGTKSMNKTLTVSTIQDYKKYFSHTDESVFNVHEIASLANFEEPPDDHLMTIDVSPDILDEYERENEKLAGDLFEAVKNNPEKNQFQLERAVAKYENFINKVKFYSVSFEEGLLQRGKDLLFGYELKEELNEALEDKDIKKITQVLKEIKQIRDVRKLLRADVVAAEARLQSIARVERMKLAAAELTTNMILEIRKYEKPKKVVHDVMKATLLILGYHEGLTRKWEQCRALCQTVRNDDHHGFLAMLKSFNNRRLEPEIASRATDILSKYNEDDAEAASLGVLLLFYWATEVAEERLNKAGDSVEAAITIREQKLIFAMRQFRVEPQ